MQSEMSQRQVSSLSREYLRTVLLSSLGGVLELYDFVIFIFLASIIGRLFFPQGMSEWLRLVQTFGIFAAGYLARPLGGIFIAHFGDTLGRKRMFRFSIMLLAIPTLAIACLPTWDTIGAGAPLMLLILRVLQGIAIGGETPGAWVYVTEHAPAGRTGLAVGLLTGGLTGGVLMGSFVATMLNTIFSPVQITESAWRLPFAIGGVLGLLVALLRRWLGETPVFASMTRSSGAGRRLPLYEALLQHRRALLAIMASMWMQSTATIVVTLLTPTLLYSIFGLSIRVTQTANLAFIIALTAATVAAGAATDRFGLRRVGIPTLFLMIVGVYAIYLSASYMPSTLLLAYVLAGIGSGGVVLTPIVMVRAFPPANRFSGVAVCYNVPYALLGGATPPLVAWLVHLNRFGAAHYVAVATVIGLVGTLFVPVAEDYGSFSKTPETSHQLKHG